MMLQCRVCSKATTPCEKCLAAYPNATTVMTKYIPPGNPPPVVEQCWCCRMERKSPGSFFKSLEERQEFSTLNAELGGLTAVLHLRGFPAWEQAFHSGWIRPFLALVSLHESDRVAIGMKLGISLRKSGETVRFSPHQEAWLLISHPQHGLMWRTKTMREKYGGKWSLSWLAVLLRVGLDLESMPDDVASKILAMSETQQLAQCRRQIPQDVLAVEMQILKRLHFLLHYRLSAIQKKTSERLTALVVRAELLSGLDQRPSWLALAPLVVDMALLGAHWFSERIESRSAESNSVESKSARGTRGETQQSFHAILEEEGGRENSVLGGMEVSLSITVLERDGESMLSIKLEVMGEGIELGEKEDEGEEGLERADGQRLAVALQELAAGDVSADGAGTEFKEDVGAVATAAAVATLGDDAEVEGGKKVGGRASSDTLAEQDSKLEGKEINSATPKREEKETERACPETVRGRRVRWRDPLEEFEPEEPEVELRPKRAKRTSCLATYWQRVEEGDSREWKNADIAHLDDDDALHLVTQALQAWLDDLGHTAMGEKLAKRHVTSPLSQKLADNAVYHIKNPSVIHFCY
ncbi:hypothetical protein CYMTET_7812 [Cymbomonas tetramitiformis]|uniref:Uncharacterized protein n=1 Tax=Cymbomonas tetramitiformis TaxID=36881 RepID=A0AAE0GUX5_9CHLO|nr:hypothetical protein CYMTET_7812 [Cymbomonas tetramitiformis]